MENNPLVTIIVITYNSSEFVIETLESAKYQTYKNIELIISDDCSTDNTFELCKNWLDKNSFHFANSKLLSTDHNKGISGNCNNGLFVATGDWVKFIAGDDILLPNCIELYIDYAFQNPSSKIIVGGLVGFNEKNEEKELNPPKCFQNFTAQQQFRWMLEYGTAIWGAAPIINKKTILYLNGFDERFPFSEDFPFYIKATKHGVKIHILKTLCVRYRIHKNSISHCTNNKFEKSYYNFLNNEIPLLLLSERMYFLYWHKKVVKFLLTRKHKFPFKYIIFRYLILLSFDPYSYKVRFNRKKKSK